MRVSVRSYGDGMGVPQKKVDKLTEQKLTRKEGSLQTRLKLLVTMWLFQTSFMVVCNLKSSFLAAANDSSEVKTVQEDKALICEDWKENIFSLLDSAPSRLNPTFFGIEQYFAAKSLISSRGFEIDDFHGFGMVPLADLFNHKTGAEDVHFTASSNSVADDDVVDDNSNNDEGIFSGIKVIDDGLDSSVNEKTNDLESLFRTKAETHDAEGNVVPVSVQPQEVAEVQPNEISILSENHQSEVNLGSHDTDAHEHFAKEPHGSQDAEMNNAGVNIEISEAENLCVAPGTGHESSSLTELVENNPVADKTNDLVDSIHTEMGIPSD